MTKAQKRAVILEAADKAASTRGEFYFLAHHHEALFNEFWEFFDHGFPEGPKHALVMFAMFLEVVL